MNKEWWASEGENLLRAVLGERFKRMRYDAEKAEFETFEVIPGRVTAKVKKGKSKTCYVRLDWEPIVSDVWKEMLVEIKSAVVWQASLLNDTLPESATGLFQKYNVGLWPDSPEEINVYASLEPEKYWSRFAAYTFFHFLREIRSKPEILLLFRGGDLDFAPARTAKKEGAGDSASAKPGLYRRETDANFWSGKKEEFSAILEGFRALKTEPFIEKIAPAPYEIKKRNLREYLVEIYEDSAAILPESAGI